MKHIKLFEGFDNQKIKEGFTTIGLGLIAAISIIRYILKIIKGVKIYKSLSRDLLAMARINSVTSIKKQEALEVVEYNDRYYLKFKNENIDIKVFKNERVLSLNSKDKTYKIPLSQSDYNEFISIIKSKIKQ